MDFKDTYWEYRIIEHESPAGAYYKVHEVWFRKDSEQPVTWSVEPVGPHGHSIKDIKKSIDLISLAKNKSILKMKDILNE